MIPNLFSKKPLPDKVPEDMQRVIDMLKRSKSKEECLKKAYDVMTGKYRGYYLETYVRILDVFNYDIFRLWKTDGFIHCTNIGYVLRTLLVKSGHFTDDDIEIKNALIILSPHQYARVRVSEDKVIDVDVWGRAHGIGLGDHAHGFHVGMLIRE
jgi:hypothetical protein